jgi:1,4-alpha-glucan branching enzyme
MDEFGGSLSWARTKRVVYHESHDEAGNSENSARCIVVASNYSPLVGDTRVYAEARCRFAFGMTVLSPGTPMFLFGEEVGAFHPYRYNDFVNNKDDLVGLKNGEGQYLFRFYSDLINFRKNNDAIRSKWTGSGSFNEQAQPAHSIDIVHVHNENRVIAFRRWNNTQEFLIVASLSNSPFSDGYWINNIRSGDGAWQEVFNSDWEGYRGRNVGNSGGYRESHNESINLVIPACGFVVFRKQ